jgi:hypothetical protein
MQERHVIRQAPSSPPPSSEPQPAPALVGVIKIPASCPDCYDIEAYLDELSTTIPIDPMEIGDLRENERERLLDAFSPSRLPAIAFNGSLADYPALLEGWEQVGTIITIVDEPFSGTWYVLPTLNAPYEDDQGVVHGRVTVTYLTKNACAECYNVTTLRQDLAAAGISPYRERFVDIDDTEGRVLAGRYNITRVPALLLDKEADEYPLRPGWNLVGTVEEDGTYVLRDLRRLEVTYYDTISQSVVRP